MPIAFEEVSAVKRPRRKPAKQFPANQAAKRKRKLKSKPSPLDREWKNYRAAKKIHNLSTRFVQLMSRLRASRPSALDLVTLLRKEMTEHPEMVAHLDLHPSDRSLNAAAA